MRSNTKSKELFPWILIENIHWLVAGLVLIYLILSELGGFYLLGAPPPWEDRVTSRCPEVMILWGLVYSIVIVCSVALNKPIMNRRAILWGTFAPILFGFAVVAWVWWRNGFALNPSGPPGLLGTYLRLAPALPAVGGLGIGALVWFESSVARRVFNRRCVNPSCQRCGYDLTLNESGVCPECGRQVQENKPLPRHGTLQ